MSVNLLIFEKNGLKGMTACDACSLTWSHSLIFFFFFNLTNYSMHSYFLIVSLRILYSLVGDEEVEAQKSTCLRLFKQVVSSVVGNQDSLAPGFSLLFIMLGFLSLCKDWHFVLVAF